MQSGSGPLSVTAAGTAVPEETWTDGFPGNTRLGSWHENSAYKLPSGEVVVICSDKT